MSWLNIKFIITYVFLTYYYGQTLSYTDALGKKSLVDSCKLLNGKVVDCPTLCDHSLLIAKEESYTVHFYPCRNNVTFDASISPDSECRKPPGVSLCLHTDKKGSKNDTYSLGTVGDMTMNPNPQDGVDLLLIYATSHNQQNYTTSIYVTFCTDHCKETFTLDRPTHADDNITGYTLHLKLPVRTQEFHNLSIGSVLVIMFFVLSGLYFIGGALILKFLRGATGWEMLPNHTFWCELPVLVREGIAFTFNRCQTDGYNRI